MSTFAIDTLQFSTKLKESGFSEQQAEGVVQLLNEAQVTTTPILVDKLEMLENRIIGKIVTRTVMWMFGAITAQTAILISILALFQ